MSMLELLQQTIVQIGELPGSLVYQLVLAFAVASAWAVALGYWWRSRAAPTADPGAGRLALATGCLFVIRLVSLALALLAAAGVLDPLVLPPPYERAAGLLTTLLILWLVAFPQPARLADAAFGGAAVLVLVALGISWGVWAQEARVNAFYNNTFQETLWEWAQIIVLAGGLLGLLALALRRRPYALLGSLMLALLLTGHVLHYLYTIAGTNVPGAARLFEMAALPLLAALAYLRLPVSAPAPVSPTPAPEPDVPTAPVTLPPGADAAPTDAAALALAALGRATTQPELAAAIARGAAHLLQQPMALVLTLAADGQSAVIAAGYDREQDQPVAAGLPVLHHSPDLLAAGACGEAPAWTPPDAEAELRSLAFAAGHNASVPLLTLPLRSAAGELWALVMVMPGPQGLPWSADAAKRLAALGAPLTAAWQRVADTAASIAAAETAPAQLPPLEIMAERDAAQLAAARYQQENQALLSQLAAMQHAANVYADQLHELDSLRASLLALQPELEETRQREVAAATELTELRARLAAAAPADQPQLQAELAATQAQVAELSAELAEAGWLRANLSLLSAEIETFRAREAELLAQIERLQSKAGTAPLRPLPPASNGAHAPADEAAASAPTVAMDVPALPPPERATTPVTEAQAPGPDAAAELETARQQLVRLQTELDLTRAELSQRPAGGAVSAFDSSEDGLSEMLEALATAEAKLTAQAAELEAARQALAESERQRLIPAAPNRPMQAADMEFIVSLAQELRQPMSSIIGYADLLLSESVGIVGALQRKFLERIRASSERIGVLLDDLMRVMDIDSGNLQLAQESVDVARVVEDVLRTTSGQFLEKNLRLVTAVSPHLPPLQADRDALLQIFTHLLGNSGAASAADSEVRLSVQLQSEARPGLDPLNYLIISVTDTGGGIAPEDQPRVFSRLYRADAPLIAGLGDNGMGLSIVKALVEGHGGRIWVISEAGVGSTFYVLLPLEGKAAKAAPAKAPAPL
ncbi:MAG: hypothetical protein IT317_01350 [Anaerolineales bacterium]|nr:hypothetical protein [Anaerolineales bacterium]